MFITGAAGSGKSCAVEVAKEYCIYFCRMANILWDEWSFFFTAYTGAAASLFVHGLTICKIERLMKKGPFSRDEINQWKHVSILLIDEISFMKEKELIKLDQRLKQVRDKNKPFGGISIVFCGDFRQLEPTGAKENNLLFSSQSFQHFWNTLNSVVILENNHRFTDDPQFGQLLRELWKGGLSKESKALLNTRVVGEKNNLVLPKDIGDNSCYACAYNRERNAITAGIFKKHILQNHPEISSFEDPPDHTIIIEADIYARSRKSDNNTNSGLNESDICRTLKNRMITTCGDEMVTCGTKLIDPALCLYAGCHLMCNFGNEGLNKSIPRGNGTTCRLVSIKLKRDPTSLKWKNYYGRKVWTVCAKDVKWIRCEHIVKTKEIKMTEKRLQEIKNSLTQNEQEIVDLERRLQYLRSKRQFNILPKKYSAIARVKPHFLSSTFIPIRCSILQFSVNSNDGTTCHKLQGTSKDIIIIPSWPKCGLFRNWEYTVLSRVRTLAGLFLLQPIDMEKSFEPSPELQRFLRWAERKEQLFLDSLKRPNT
eukprot:scaffold77192_cov37-Cyclotella_meneghiniana.AAC.2